MMLKWLITTTINTLAITLLSSLGPWAARAVGGWTRPGFNNVSRAPLVSSAAETAASDHPDAVRQDPEPGQDPPSVQDPQVGARNPDQMLAASDQGPSPAGQGGGASAPTAGAVPADQGSPDAGAAQVETDPLAPFNEAMFWFNRKLDDYVLHPVASGYAKVVPVAARRHVGMFFDNIDFIPRFANNLFQLRLPQAGSELGRFAVNTTVGVGGLFDPAGQWLGLKEYPDDFGLTLGRYGVAMGPYLMLPFFGPSSIRDAIGLGVDGLMNPMDWLLPWYITVPANTGWRVGEAVNYESLNLDLFSDVDRYAVDLYGAVQDGYIQRRKAVLQEK